MNSRRRMINSIEEAPISGVVFNSISLGRHQPIIQPLGMDVTTGEVYRVIYDIVFNISEIASAPAIYHLYNWNICATFLSGTTSQIVQGANIVLHIDKYFMCNKSSSSNTNWLIDTRNCSGVAYISNYSISLLDKVLDIPLIENLNLTTDTDIIYDKPGFSYGDRYLINFDYSVNVKAISTTNMVFAIKNYSAFIYQALKTISPTTTTIGVYNGSAQYIVSASKNAGDLLRILFRPYGGVADCTISNFKIFKLENELLDSFDRPNATSLGSADTRQIWSPLYCTWKILDNCALIATRTANNSPVGVETYWPNVEIETLFEHNQAGTGLYFRGNSVNEAAQNSLGVTIENNGLVLKRFENYSMTVIGTYPFTPVLNRDYKLKVVCDGDILKVYLDDILLIEKSESLYKTKSSHGMLLNCNGLSLSRYKNISIKRI